MNMEDSLMIEQYKMLRAQIMQNLNHNHTLLLTSYTMIGAMMALAILTNNPLIYTVIFIILVAVSAKIRALNNSLQRISTYMRTFLEPEMNGMDWETNLYLLHQCKFDKTGPSNAITDVLFFRNNSMSLIIAIIVYLFFLHSLLDNITIHNIMIGGSISTLSLLTVLFLTIKDDNSAEWEKAWSSLKNSLETSLAE